MLVGLCKTCMNNHRCEALPFFNMEIPLRNPDEKYRCARCGELYAKMIYLVNMPYVLDYNVTKSYDTGL